MSDHDGVVRNSGLLEGGDFPDDSAPSMRRSMGLGQAVSSGASFDQITPIQGGLATIERSVSVIADDRQSSARLRGCALCRGSFLFRTRLWLRGTPTERGIRLPNGRKPRSDFELQLATEAAADATTTVIEVS